MLGARIAQRRQVYPRKERLATTEQDRRDRDVHFVDVARLEILAHRGRPAADLDIAPARGLPGATERFLNSTGEEMIDGPALHRDRVARVVRQHEHRHVIRWVLAPPAAPLIVGPRPAHRAEHVSAHDIRTDAFPEALGKIVVGTRRSASFPVYLVKRARVDVPAVQLLTTHAEWVLLSLAGARAVTVERDREVVNAQLGHGFLWWFHMRRVGRPEIDATPESHAWGTRSSHLQPLNDGLDAGVGPNGSIERVREREIDSTDVRRGALHQPLDRRLPVAKSHEGVCDQVFPNVLRLRTRERLPERFPSTRRVARTNEVERKVGEIPA